MFIYIGTYADNASAQDDYDIVKDLHAVGAVGTYDAAVVTKDDKGKVHENKDEMATRHGAWGGAAVGALIEALIPRGMRIYGQACGWTLAHAHARSGDRVAMAAYLGSSDAFDKAITQFASAYADQNERDHQALVDAVASGRLTAEPDM